MLKLPRNKVHGKIILKTNKCLSPALFQKEQAGHPWRAVVTFPLLAGRTTVQVPAALCTKKAGPPLATISSRCRNNFKQDFHFS